MDKEGLLQELRFHDIKERILEAIKKVPREEFILPEDKKYAYSNHPLPIHEGQTISQPLTVALMSQWLDVKPGHSVLEVGTGSGYQAAVLSFLAGSVTTYEVRKRLYEFAKKNLVPYKNVKVLHANAMKRAEGRYDRIIVTASASKMPEKLLDHLKEGGKMVVPVGDEMWLIEKNRHLKKEMKGHFAFVPLVE